MFLLLKKASQEYPQPMDVFFQFSFEVTLRLQITTKGGGGGERGWSAVTAIITQFYFYFAHLKSTWSSRIACFWSSKTWQVSRLPQVLFPCHRTRWIHSLQHRKSCSGRTCLHHSLDGLRKIEVWSCLRFLGTVFPTNNKEVVRFSCLSLTAPKTCPLGSELSKNIIRLSDVFLTRHQDILCINRVAIKDSHFFIDVPVLTSFSPQIKVKGRRTA